MTKVAAPSRWAMMKARFRVERENAKMIGGCRGVEVESAAGKALRLVFPSHPLDEDAVLL